ncbi:hypothetical protein PQQ86_15675 [Paraburkholderia sediminicola]|uniref:hypothetical protein n=1 Tax=Paraburkholderia sediminicola TaxID=458836 RepID=UPI0038BC08DF
MKLCIKTPTPKRPVVDGLVFLLPWGCEPLANQQALFERARRRIQKEIDDGFCTPAFVKFKRYRFSFNIPLPGKSKALVQIGALDLKRQKGGISVTMNPAKFAVGDVEHFHEIMTRIVGASYRSLTRRALLNHIDFAVDIVHADLSRMLISYSNAQQFTVFGKTVNSAGIIETYNFGSEKSDYMTSVYDKSAERRHRAILNIAKHGRRNEPLTANFIKQLEQLHGAPPVVRVEVRGKKLRGLLLHKLGELENRFARFTFADLNGQGSTLPKKLEDEFMSLCRDRGVKAALEHYKGTSDVREINAFWRSHKASWWKPDTMWAQACAELRKTGLFPAAAFHANNESNSQREAPPLEDVAPRAASPVARAETRTQCNHTSTASKLDHRIA